MPLTTFETSYAHYRDHESGGIMIITVAALISLSAVVLLLMTKISRTKAYRNTHILGYFVSLLMANIVQSTGTVMNIKWIQMGGVVTGKFCSAQGGIKQAGNIGTALWSFMISLHLFNLLFLRLPSTKAGFWVTLVVGWAAVIAIVVGGPLMIGTQERGPYFGISGPWCWITPTYRREQIFLEYFLEFLSVGLGFLLYTAVLLRVRGNLLYSEGKLRLRFVPYGQSWQLSFARDLLDSSMLRVARNMVWYPIVYAVIITPIAVARLTVGNGVPYSVTVLTATIFNLIGLLNVILFMYNRRLFSEAGSLPEFTTPRRQFNGGSAGVTPFTMVQSDNVEHPQPDAALTDHAQIPPSRFSISTVNSVYSVNSQTPMTAPHIAR